VFRMYPAQKAMPNKVQYSSVLHLRPENKWVYGINSRYKTTKLERAKNAVFRNVRVPQELSLISPGSAFYAQVLPIAYPWRLQWGVAVSLSSGSKICSNGHKSSRRQRITGSVFRLSSRRCRPLSPRNEICTIV
jgi:hypothetical protein